MTAKGAALSGMSRAWAASGALLTVENLGMATIVYAVAFVAFWLGWYAPTTPTAPRTIPPTPTRNQSL